MSPTDGRSVGKPVADLVPRVKEDIVFGELKGKIHYDPDAFDDEDPEILEMFGIE